MLEYACIVSTQERDAGGAEVQGHPWLHSKFEARMKYRRFCLKKIVNNVRKKNNELKGTQKQKLTPNYSGPHLPHFPPTILAFVSPWEFPTMILSMKIR